MDPEALFAGTGDLPGYCSTTTTLQPARSIDYDEGEWAGAIVVVVSGQLHLECRSGERASFDEGAVLFLTGLRLRRITNPGLTPLVLRSIRRRPGPRPPLAP
jgi:hypothetical protein